MKIRDQISFAAGVMYLVIAAAFAVGARDLQIGTAGSMGPGYFPLVVSSLLGLVGLIVLVTSLHSSAAPTCFRRWYASKLTLILGAVVVFALLLTRAGLVLSIFALVLIASFASDEFDWRVALLNAAVLAAMGVAIFVYGLGLFFPLWPQVGG